jgi:hypothetical protein
MSDRLEVQIFPCVESFESSCPLCGEGISAAATAGLLYEGERTLGCICGKCLRESPREVAGRLRVRVADLYKFVRKARHYLRDEHWSRYIDRVRLRAEHWDALSGRLASLREWPISEAHELVPAGNHDFDS